MASGALPVVAGASARGTTPALDLGAVLGFAAVFGLAAGFSAVLGFAAGLSAVLGFSPVLGLSVVLGLAAGFAAAGLSAGRTSAAGLSPAWPNATPVPHNTAKITANTRKIAPERRQPRPHDSLAEMARIANDAAMELEPDEIERYARHIVLREVGGPGQAKLKRARVLVIGAGGLGAPVLLYLAAAGVGTLGVIDDDKVSLSNLQRQVIHGTPDLDARKVESAASAIGKLNPHVNVVTHAERLTAKNALPVIGGYDIVADGSDNFATRYLVADACYFANKPLVTAAVGTFDGTLTTIRAHERSADGTPNPTYRCLFRRAAAARRRAGVLGGRYPRRAARHSRFDDGAGGDPRDRRIRRGLGRPAAYGRCARHAVRDGELQLGPGQSAERRGADHPGPVGPQLNRVLEWAGTRGIPAGVNVHRFC